MLELKWLGYLELTEEVRSMENKYQRSELLLNCTQRLSASHCIIPMQRRPYNKLYAPKVNSMASKWLRYSPQQWHAAYLQCEISTRCGLLDWPCAKLLLIRLLDIALLWRYQSPWMFQSSIPKRLDMFCKLELKLRLIQLAEKNLVIRSTMRQKRL